MGDVLADLCVGFTFPENGGVTTATDHAACGLALKFRKAEPVGVLRDIFQILQKIVIFLSYLIIAKETDTDYTNSTKKRYCFAFLFAISRARARNRKTYTAQGENQHGKHGTHRRQGWRIPGHWNRVLPAMILTGTVLGGTAHGIRFQIKNLYTC